MAKYVWKNGTQIAPAKVQIGTTTYEVTPAQYEGETPLSAANLNTMQDNLIDLLYPVGSYYETSNTSFNPNTAWGGTWILNDTAGRVTVALQSTDDNFNELGKTGGSTSNKHTHSRAEDGKTISTVNNQAGSFVIGQGNVVGNTTISILQPYVVVNRWHRTA